MDVKPLPQTKHSYGQDVAPHAAFLLRMAFSMTNDWNDAEDLCQDTLLKAWKAYDRFDGRYPKAWLVRILRNTFIDFKRKSREFSYVEDSSDPIWGVSDAAEDKFVDEYTSPHILEALDALDDQFRDVFILVDVEGFSYQETAEALGIPIGTVMSRLHRSRKKLVVAVSALEKENVG